ncbi:MAG: complex I subunit 5 family protein [Alkalispirochaetaceae bacterium]
MSVTSALPWLPVLLPIFAAALAYYLPRKLQYAASLAAEGVQFALSLWLFLAVGSGGTLEVVPGGWPAGVGIRLMVDMAAAFLILITAAFFLLVLLFNARKLYMDRLFLFLLLLLQGLLVATVVSGDLFNVYVLLELSTLVVAILIMYKRGKQTLLDGMVYLMLNLASMSFVLLGIGMVYRVLGTLDFAVLARRAAAAGEPRALIAPFVLVVTGVGMKSALIMLFPWLPKAHGAPSAPSAVSAVLSGIQVKAGLIVLVRLIGIFGTPLPLQPLFVFLGLATGAAGAILALGQTDLKRILAYSTISQIGLMVFGFALGSDQAWWGALVHIGTHAVAKAVLFLTAGIVIHVYHERSVHRVRGVARRMPLVALSMSFGMLSILGVPIFGGGVSKYLIQSAGSSLPGAIFWTLNGLTALIFVRMSVIFFGRAPQDAGEGEAEAARAHASRQPELFTGSVIVLFAAAAWLLGLFTEPVVSYLSGAPVHLDAARGVDKWLEVGLLLALASGVNRFLLRPFPLLESIGERDLAFPDLVSGVLIFVAGIGGWLFLMTR